MLVLLDECLPHDLRHEFVGHDARTASYMCWAGKRNGELLALMQADGFAVLATVDQGIPHQQNLRAAGVAVVLMKAAGNGRKALLPLMPSVLAALAAIKPGDVVEIDK